MEKLTPVMQQYFSIKEKYPDAILLFRLGDFYETFAEDAEEASRILGIVLTSRDGKFPMAGFPAHAASSYIHRLLKAGKKVAVCEQLEEPSGRKLVKRDVVEVITPGTFLEEEFLDEKRNNYIAAMARTDFSKGNWVIAFCDLSTGELGLTTANDTTITGELARISPAELLLMEGTSFEYPAAFNLPASYFSPIMARGLLQEFFGVETPKAFGLEETFLPVLGALLRYIKENKKTLVQHIRPPRVYPPSGYVLMDKATFAHLGISQLADLLDFTKTPMGARLLRRWISRPLSTVKEIQKRLFAVQVFYENSTLRQKLRESLQPVGDMERILSKVAFLRARPYDLLRLREYLKKSRDIVEFVPQLPLFEGPPPLDKVLEVITVLENALKDELNPGQKEDFIKEGFDSQLDEYRTLTKDSSKLLLQIEEQEKRRTGIPNLKIGYNRVFGYYIEITKSYLSRVPSDYIRKQTLANAERFTTQKLQELEEKILTAQENMALREEEVFSSLQQFVRDRIGFLQEFSNFIATIDVVSTIAEVSHKFGYVKPQISREPVTIIKDGRHPIVERTIDEPFVPNDTVLDTSDNRLLVITGPNMSGKSTYLRQVALITIMAQAGFFVPASEAVIGVVDRIFSRIGAGEDIARGESTFMTEMLEVSNILNNATERSLVILDEVGRGTSTFDGMSIAWAVAEYIHDKIKCRTLFATHYHELTELGRILKGAKNFHFSAKQWQDKIVFLRKLEPGASDRSYGIHVARLAGLPKEVIERAFKIMEQLERNFSRAEVFKVLFPSKPIQRTLFDV